MELLALSLNVNKVPLEIRERLSFATDELAAATEQLKNEQSVLENVILSTCNRTEIYAVVDQAHRGLDYLERFLAQWFKLPLADFADYLAVYHERDVVNYLFRVTCGLESLIVGEEQILSQVRTSFLTAQANQATGSILNRLFKQAVTLGKRAHTETQLSRNSVSVGSAAVALAKREFGNLSSANCLVIGAGEMSGLSAKYLAAQAPADLIIANRTLSNAQKLSVKFDRSRATDLSNLTEVLAQADVVLSSTAAKKVVLTAEMVQAALAKRAGRPLILLDLAVPRDIEPSVAGLEAITLFDIDDLRQLVADNLAERKQAEKEVETIIADEQIAFEHWLKKQAVVPIITALQDKGMKIQASAMTTIEHKLSNLTEHDRKVINKLTKSIVNQLLREPILQVKGFASETEKLENFKNIFGLEEENDTKI